MSNLDYDHLKEEIIYFINSIFTLSASNNLKSINDLSNEFILKSLLVEIDPSIEKNHGKIELTNDKSFGIRYGNFVAITKCINNYIDRNVENQRMRDKNFFRNNIIINDILKNDKDQMILLVRLILNKGKLIMVLCTICQNNDSFLNKISNLKNGTQDIYFTIIDEFLKSDQSFNTSRFSEFNNSEYINQRSFLHNDMKMNKKLEEYEKDQKKYVYEKERELNEIKMRNIELERRNTEYEVKYKDLFRELESLKSNSKFGGMNMHESLVNNELETRLQQRENELEDKKKEFEMMERHFTEERNNLKEKLNVMQDKLLELKTVNSDNEKLKTKIKELLQFKDKCFDYDNLVISLEARNKQIENFNNEKKKLLETIEKLQKDMNAEKEKYRQLEYDKKKMEFEYNDIKKDMSRMENQLKKKEINNINNISEVRRAESVNISEAQADKYNLLDIDKDSLLFELDKNKEERTKNLEKELHELRVEKQEITRNYKSQVDEIHNLIEEKDKLLNELDFCKMELNKTIQEKEKLIIEKGKLEIQSEKIQLELQKSVLNYNKIQNEKRVIEEDKKDLQEKIEIYGKEKGNFQKEIEILKLQNHNSKLNLEKITNENKNLHHEVQTLHSEVDKMKQSVNIIDASNTQNKTSLQKKISPKNVAGDNTELTNLKSELNLIKSSNGQKEDMIKMLKDKVKNLEQENKNMMSQMQDNLDKYNDEMLKRSEDLEFYKRSYEEQKNRVNREHELISTSLYELALQFMSLKNELQKKMNANNIPIKNA